MPIIPLKIPSRIDELTALGAFVLASYIVDLNEFTGFSPDYTQLHATNVDIELKAVDELINPKVLVAELKVITKRIYANQDTVANKLTLLEGYIKRAIGLTIAPADFGISAARTSNRSGDIEGLVTNMGTITKNVTNPINKAALLAKGYTALMQTNFEALTKSFKDDNTAQNSKMDARSVQVKNNHVAINALWVKLNDICDAGKRIFSTGAAEKKKQYTVTSLLSRMRNDAKKTAIGGAVEPKARIEFKPLHGGRKRVAYANAAGIYDLKGISPGEYLATMSVKGKPSMTANVVIITGEIVVENFGMIR